MAYLLLIAEPRGLLRANRFRPLPICRIPVRTSSIAS